MKLVNNNYNVDVVDGVLERYGVSKMELLNPSNEFKNGYEGMDRAVNRIKKAIETKEGIGVLVDDDCDGFTSSAVLISYLNKLTNKVCRYFHDGKQHGLNNVIIDKIKESEVSLLVIPDASSSDELLVKLPNIDIIILDHHLFEVEVPDNVIRVNNQNPNNIDSNHNLTGVGMVYRTLQNLDNVLGVSYSEDDLDLVAIGQIGDSSDYSEQEVRWIVNEGLNNLNNKLLKVMLKDRIDRMDIITGRDCSFEVIPYINAVTRIGTLDEKESLFKGLIQDSTLDEIQIVTRKRKDKITKKFKFVEEEHNGYELLFDDLVKIKKRQAKEIDKFVDVGIERIHTDGGVIIAKAVGGVDTSLTGLIASKLSNNFGRPTILITPRGGNVFIGSLRGKEERVKSLKDWCEGTNLFNWVQGHDNAAGCEIYEENILSLVEKTKSIEVVEEIEVDYLSDTITPRTIRQIYDNRGLFGGKVNYPKIGIVNKVFKKNMITPRGEKTLVLKDEKQNVDYIIFNVSEEIRQQLLQGFSKTVKVDILGEASVNYFLGRKNLQVVVDRIEISNQKEDFLFDF